MNLAERIKKNWVIALILLFAAAVAGYVTFNEAIRKVGSDIDDRYHSRSADGALIQFDTETLSTAAATEATKSGIRRVPQTYTATFENRSDGILVITHAVFDLSAAETASAWIENTADGGPVDSTAEYQLAPACSGEGEQALIPPFQIHPGRVSRFRVNLTPSLPEENPQGCTLAIRFRTNQGMTNYSLGGLIMPSLGYLPERSTNK